MNLVQMAEHAKNLSNQQLQQMLQRPDGAMPPFILAAEAARRQDIEKSAQIPQDTGTVLDELIQGRAQASGGLNSLQPGAPQQAMNCGGGVKRYAGGALVGPGVARQAPLQPFEMPSFSGVWEFLTKPRNLVGGDATDQIVRDRADIEDPIPSANSGIMQLSPAEDYGEKQKLARYQTRIRDEAAAAKEAETANKKGEMGDTGADDAAPEGGAEADEFRDRLAALYGEEDDVRRLLGFSSSGLARMGAALLSRERGLSEGQRWANAAAAMAEDTEARDLNRQKIAQEEELALLKYDMAKKAADDASASAGVDEMASAYKDTAAYYIDVGKAYAEQAEKLRRAYQKTNEFGIAIPGETAQIPPEIQDRINKLEKASQDAFSAAHGYQQQFGGIRGVEIMGVYDDDGNITYPSR